MAVRQSTTPVHFNKSKRTDTCVTMSSARAGVVVPVAYVPLLAGDSASGRIGIDVALKEMPKPLLNAVHANFQAWFVPKSAFPQFSSRDEVTFAMAGEKIKALGAADRDPPPYFNRQWAAGAFMTSKIITTLGLHSNGDVQWNADLVDAFTLIYNFRLAAHSSRLKRRKYASEANDYLKLPPAFWPSSRMAKIVPDYERALVVGALDLDVAAGRVPLSGSGVVELKAGSGPWSVRRLSGTTDVPDTLVSSGGSALTIHPDNTVVPGPIALDPGGSLSVDVSQMFAEMSGQSIGITLADIDKARTTQAFAKLMTAYAGNDATGFENSDHIVALLMQGISVPIEQFSRPWLLDSKRVPVGFAERFATDAANLDQSVTVGRASATLSLNVPQQDVGGIIIVTCEVLPERVDERMSDEWLHCVNYDDLPNALRDIQRVEPVDLVPNRRVDARHSRPDGLYGYEPMNEKWNRNFTRLGGDFYMPTPGGGWTENRSNIWQTEIVDPTFSKHHYLAPSPFPHDVFADENADAFEFVARHNVTIVGLTQFGDILAENNGEYEFVEEVGK